MPDSHACIGPRRWRHSHWGGHRLKTILSASALILGTSGFAAAYAHLGRSEQCPSHRDTVYRHYRRQLARGMFRDDISCIDWLLALDPFRRPADAEHYQDGLRKAGFD